MRNKLTTRDLVNYITNMTNPEMDAYAVTLRSAITLGADIELCNEGTRIIMRERFRRATIQAKTALRAV